MPRIITCDSPHLMPGDLPTPRLQLITRSCTSIVHLSCYPKGFSFSLTSTNKASLILRWPNMASSSGR